MAATKIASKLIKPPISLFGLEGSYVNALYSAASKKNQLAAVEGDLKTVAHIYKTEPKFRDFVTDPFIKSEQKMQVFGKLKINELSVNFLTAMADNNRIKHLPSFQESFKKAMAASRDEVQVTVTSAKPLTDTKKKEVEDSIKGFTKKKMLLSYEVDPEIIGGLVIDFNNEHLIDMSIKTKVRTISNAIQAS